MEPKPPRKPPAKAGGDSRFACMDQDMAALARQKAEAVRAVQMKPGGKLLWRRRSVFFEAHYSCADPYADRSRERFTLVPHQHTQRQSCGSR
ncbi:MAG: hypothetical protein WBF42_05930 [Terracidiphilus sp.]